MWLLYFFVKINNSFVHSSKVLIKQTKGGIKFQIKKRKIILPTNGLSMQRTVIEIEGNSKMTYIHAHIRQIGEFNYRAHLSASEMVESFS